MNVKIIAVVFACCCLALLAAADCHSANITSLDSTLRNYFSEPRDNRMNNGNKTKTRNFIINTFLELGLQPQLQNCTHPRYGECWNIIGVLNGSNLETAPATDKPVGVAAHYDTFYDEHFYKKNTPGVNDNGSGMAALLEVARLITDEHKNGIVFKNTMLFVAFDLEELYYTGSKNFKAEWLSPWMDRIYNENASNVTMQGIIVMDTVMSYNEANNSQQFPDGMDFLPVYNNTKSNDSKGNFIVNIYREERDSLLGTTFTHAWRNLSNLRIEEILLPPWDEYSLAQNHVYDNLMRSDHRNLWNDSISAIFLTDTANYRMTELRPNESCYHMPCDKINIMATDSNLNFLSKTTDAIVETLRTLSVSTPVTNDCKTANVHVGKRSIRDPVALDSTDGFKVNFDTKPTPKINGCHPVIPESIMWTMVLATILANIL